MDVSTIVQRIIDLGLNENAPDTDLQTKALGWLNAAYKEAYNVAVSYAWPQLYSTAAITITNGVGTFPFYPRRVIKLIDQTSKRELKQSDIGFILGIDPALSRTGNPARYYTNGQTGLNTHPKNDTTVFAVLVPQAADLAADGAETDIKIPPHHHELLIWASLLEAMMYERGFGNDSLLQVASARKGILMDNYLREMRESVAHSEQRVKMQEF